MPYHPVPQRDARAHFSAGVVNVGVLGLNGKHWVEYCGSQSCLAESYVQRSGQTAIEFGSG